ncbi:MAG: hypothetical protein C0608_10500 [Deltaproteobacteria bacterium]|nr:MAG: hypothetical protein C0608_10500 [Deltaproteobacteria bacterium]
MKRPLSFIGLFACLTLFFSCASSPNNNLKTADHVDLQRYMGKWYEIARYEHPFQVGCVNSTATYTLLDNGKVEVLNECDNPTKKDGHDKAVGKAWVVDEKTNSKLKVSFFWPFRGDYWIIDLGKNYEYSVVSDPSMEYLWILSRTPQMPETTLAKILDNLQSLGFNLDLLVFNK